MPVLYGILIKIGEWAWLADPPVMVWSVCGGLTEVGALVGQDRQAVSEEDFEFKRTSCAA